ncbi:sensor domain-containing protein [Chloroflexota bacterium]
MIPSIDEYLCQLKKELTGSDSATIQDALSDAEEHLRTALNSAIESQPGTSEADILSLIIEKYGLPADVATAYRDIEARVQPAFIRPEHTDRRPILSKFFGVFADPRAWGALLYLLFSLCTGILYFTWATTGISMSLGFLILIIGLPFAGLFLLSVRVIALVEGRIVEALLGIRMPRRPLFSRRNIGWWKQLKYLVTEKRTWVTMIYMILQLPLGTIYFTVFITLITLSLSGIAMSILQLGFDIPINIGDASYYLAGWMLALVVVAGFLLATLTMHLAKYVGRMHGTLAKALLVRS